MSDLFISYAREDGGFVRRLHDALKQASRDVWIDWDGIAPTAEWLKEILAAIEGANAFVFVITPDSIASEVCRRELDHAANQGKRLVPVVHREVPGEAVPEPLAKLNWLFLREADDFDAGLHRLLEALDTDFAWVAAHTRLLVRAKEWDAKTRDASLLLRGRELAEAERWLAEGVTHKEKAPEPVSIQTELILASRNAATRGQRIKVAVAISVAIIAIGLAAWALNERRIAEERYQQALSRQLTMQADAALAARADQLPLSLLLATEAMRRVPSFETDQVMRDALKLLPRQLWRVQAPTLTGVGVRFTPDGRYVATADGAWDAATGQRAAEFRHEGRSTAFAMSRDGQWVARGDGSGNVDVYEVSSGRRLSRQPLQNRGVIRAVAFSPDRQLLAAAAQDSIVHVWDTTNTNLIQRLDRLEPTLSGEITALEFSVDGQYLGASRRQTVGLWEVARWAPVLPPIARQTGEIRGFAFGPAGQLALVSTGGEVSVRVSPEAPWTRLPLAAALGTPRGIAFSAQGEYVGVSGQQGSQIWDVAQATLVVRTEQGSAVLAFSPDGTSVATGGADNTARIIELASSRELARMVHDGEINALAFSPDGRSLAIASSDGTLRLWETTVPYPAARLRGDTARFVAGGQHVLATKDGQAAELWNLENKLITRLPAKESPRAMILSTDGTRLVAVLEDTLIDWTLPLATEVARLAHSPPIDWDQIQRREEDERKRAYRQVRPEIERMRTQGSVKVIALSRDGRYALTSRIDEIARLWDLVGSRHLADIAYQERVLASFSTDGLRLATWAPESGLQIWESASGSLMARLPATGEVTALALTHDGRKLIAVDAKGGTLWDVEGQAPLASMPEARQVKLSPDGRLFFTEESNRARLWEPASGRVVTEVPCTCRIRETLFSADSRLGAVVGDDNMVRIRSAQSASLTRDLNHSGQLDDVVFSPDGKMVAMTGADPRYAETEGNPGQPRATGASDPWLRLWALEGDREVELALALEESPGSAPVFSPDSRFVAVGAYVWDVGTGNKITRVEGTIVGFSADQGYLLSRTADWVRLWRWRPNDLIADACARLSASLSTEVWRRYLGSEQYRATCPRTR